MNLLAVSRPPVAGNASVLDGNYGIVRDLVWRRATHLIWLDYDRPIIMYRVIRRSLNPGGATHGDVGRQPREVATHVAAKPSHPVGLAHVA